MKQQHTLQPKLRFPEFEEDWIEKKYKEIIIENRLGGNYDNFDEISDFPLIKMGNIGRGNIILSKIQYLKCEENINNNDILRKGDLLFNTRNTLELVGKVAVWNNELDFALYNSNLMRMTFDNNIIESTNLFMNSLFNQLKTIKQLRSIATGTTSVAAIYNKDLNNIKFLFPSLTEQQKIADYLATIDNKINLLEEKKAQLALYKKAMMQKLFTQEIRFKPTHCHTELVEAYPEWEEKRLGEVCTFFSGGTPLSSNKDYYIGNIPFIKSGEINADYTEQFINADALKNSSAKIVEKGDLLYALYGATSGQSSISKIYGAINQAVLCIRSEKLNLIYLNHLLVNNKQKIIDKFLQGGQGNLSASIIKDLKYYLPPLLEQQKIADFLSAIDESIEKVNEQISQTQSFKKAMLQGMFV